MKEDHIDLFVEFLFPMHFRLMGLAFFVAAIVPIYPLLSAGLILLALMFNSTHYRVRFSLADKKYKEYTWFLFLKRGKEKPLINVEYLYINSNQDVWNYGRVAQLTSTKTKFALYLKLTGADSVYIGESTNESKLNQKAQKLAEFLKISIKKNY